MYRLVSAFVLIFCSLGGLAQAPPDIRTLYEQLTNPTETSTAAPRIRELASKDSTARGFMAQRLPSMIKSRPAGPTNLIWMNAVRLAGQLKVTNAIPALKDALSLGPIRGGYDYGTSDNYPSPSEGVKLRYDIVGRALADIGDASVPTVADILSRGDASMRKRAFFILSNIGSPAAHQTMRDHLADETDPDIRRLIQRELHLAE